MKPRWVICTTLAVAAWLFLLGLCLAADPPPAPPVPKPAPPAPVPTETIPAGRLWLLCIFPDVNRQTPAQGAIPANAALRKLLDAHANHFRWVDPQTAPPELAAWIAQAEKDGLPRALIVDAAPGGSLVKDSVPLTSARDMLSLLQKWGGK